MSGSLRRGAKLTAPAGSVNLEQFGG